MEHTRRDRMYCMLQGGGRQIGRTSSQIAFHKAAVFSFPFYLFHSAVLNRIFQYIPFQKNIYCYHFILMTIAAVITILLSVFWMRILPIFRIDQNKEK